MVLLVGWLVVVVVVVVDSSSVESVSDVFVTVTVGCDLVAWSFEESMDFSFTEQCTLGTVFLLRFDFFFSLTVVFNV